MQTTGELIRLLGYVDEIAATLHRIDATIPTLTSEERKRLAEYMRLPPLTEQRPGLSNWVRNWVRVCLPSTVFYTLYAAYCLRFSIS
jgi:hypothetical protein